MRPVEIWIGGYYHMSGGIRALHVLRDELRARGIPADMSYERQHAVADVIGIYPEIVPNNPEGYSRIIRWKLNKADLPDDGPTYAWETGMGEHPLLTVNIVEDFFHPRPNTKTNTVAYWAGKGVVDPAVLPDGAIAITRSNHPDRVELARFLASVDLLISFDPFTAVNLEAVVSGTPVLIHANGPWDRATISQHGWLPYGVAWQASELERARDTVGKARFHYEALKQIFQARIDMFVDDCLTAPAGRFAA